MRSTGRSGVIGMRFELELPFKIESLNRGLRSAVGSPRMTMQKLRRQRFAMRGKAKRHRHCSHLAVKAKLPAPLRAQLLRESERLVVTLTRLGHGTLDDDNLSAGFKAVRDGIAEALQVNDRHPTLRWIYAQERTARRVYGCRVLFETMTKSELGRRLAAAAEASA